ncbi:MAG: hypothetical protein ACXAC8_02590 [Candidatus Hodarchaeales archaeon]
MGQKLSRTILIFLIITFSCFIGGIFTIQTITPSLQVENVQILNLNSDGINFPVSQNDKMPGIMEINQDSCCGHVDVTAPTIKLLSPIDGSSNPGGTTIELEVTDDNLFYEFAAQSVEYRWDNDQSNTTLMYNPSGTPPGPTNFEVVLPSCNRTYVLYVYAGDFSSNWAVATFSFTVTTICLPPIIEFVTPSAENETLTGMNEFRVDVTEDHGLLSVQMQIDGGAKLTMNYNETSGYYYRSSNVSQLTNGNHTLKVIAIDVDEDQHTVTKEIGFTVTGGLETALISNPPEWDSSLSNLPANLSEDAESGDIFFKIAVKDDVEIAAVDFTIYVLDNFDPINDEPDISDARKEVSLSLSQSGSDSEWGLYEYTWNSTKSSDSYYFCEFHIQDTDEVANHLFIFIILETDNVEDQSTGDSNGQGSSGFLILPMILALLASVQIISKNRRKEEE